MRLPRSVWFIRTVEVISAFNLIAAGFAWGRSEVVHGIIHVVIAGLLWWLAVHLWTSPASE